MYEQVYQIDMQVMPHICFLKLERDSRPCFREHTLILCNALYIIWSPKGHSISTFQLILSAQVPQTRIFCSQDSAQPLQHCSKFLQDAVHICIPSLFIKVYAKGS